jgi:hypothetical protein
VANVHDEKGSLVAYHRLPYSFKCVAKPDKDGGLLDDRPSTVPPVVSPVDAPVPPAAGPSSALHTTTNIGGAVNTPSQRSAPDGHHTSIRRPISPPRQSPQRETVETWPPSVGIGSRKDVQQPEVDAQPLLQRVAPLEGPTRGGLNVVLIGTNFPPWPTMLYARFGSAVAVTVSHSVSLGPSRSKICSPG